MRRLIIYAANIHSGGGKSLLLPLLRSAKKNLDVIAFLDKRIILYNDLTDEINVFYVNSTLHGRLIGEYKLYRFTKKTDTVLCFGNLPPLFKLKSNVILFVQNCYLVNSVSLNDFSIKETIRIFVERQWLKLFCKHADEIIVQTPIMQRLAQIRLRRIVNVVPFFEYSVDSSKDSVLGQEIQKIHDFLYVATGEPQKNHFNLVEAWKFLSMEGIYPSLCLTLQEEKNIYLVRYIKEMCVQYGLKINNVMVDKPQDLASLYKCSGALLYPSTLESFGLPLIEAQSAGLPIIASELDYVRDVVEPVVTFDPVSPISIARAVKRFMKISEKRIPIISNTEFLQHLIP